MKAVILAAGEGKRLHPLSASYSKAMVPILGAPLVERVIETLAFAGVSSYIIVVNPVDRRIREHFAGGQWPVSFVEQQQRLGMAHALLGAVPLIDDDFMLSACDSITSVEHIQALRQKFAAADAGAVLSVRESDPALMQSSSAVELRGDRVTRIIEKPAPGTAPSNLASLPLYIFSRRLLPFLPQVRPSVRGEYELQDAIQMLIESGAWVCAEHCSERYQITTVEDFLEMNWHYLALENCRSWIAPNATIEDGCTIGANTVIHARARIGSGSSLADCVVLPGATIPPNSEIRRQVIAP